MASALTANLQLRKPTRGDGLWDVPLNANFDDIDTAISDLGFNVRSRRFGAAGNGTTDDTASVNAASAAAMAAGGGAVIFPRGTYLVNLAGLTNVTNVSYVGFGYGSAIKHGGTASSIFTGGNASQLIFQGLRFHGTSQSCIILSASRQVVIDNCWFEDATLNSGSGATASLEFVNTCTDIAILHCQFSNNGLGVGVGTDNADVHFGITASGHKRVRLIGNTVSDSLGHACFHLGDTQDSIVTNNYLSGGIMNVDGLSGGYGVVFYKNAAGVDCLRNVISNNVIRGTEGSGIYLQQGHDCTVNGNVLEDVASVQPDTSLAVGGIANFGNRNTIGNNTISGSGQAGIAVAGSDTTATGNQITNCTDAGIKIRTRGSPLVDVIRCTVSGNTVSDCAHNILALTVSGNKPTGLIIKGNVIFDSKTGGRGIDVQCTRSVISGNLVYNNARDGIVVSDAGGNVVSDNQVTDNSVETANTYVGIRLHNSTNTVVNGNRSGNTVATGQSVGLLTSGTSDNNSAVGNDFQGNQTAPISVLAGSLRQLFNAGVAIGSAPNIANDFGVDVVATASLPAASADENGRILIEDGGAGDRNVIIYAGGQRFRIDGGAAF